MDHNVVANALTSLAKTEIHKMWIAARCYFGAHTPTYLYGGTLPNGYSVEHLGYHCEGCGVKLWP